MAKTITIFNQKGGVGKSTTASNLMSALTQKGKKVLGIDIDAQGNLTKFCKINTTDENTVLEVLSGDAKFDEAVVKTKHGDILPCDRNLSIYEKEFASDMSNVYALKELAEGIGANYDFIIIDCPPNANSITTSALISSDYTIIPSEAEYFSLDGIGEISYTIDKIKKRLNPKLKVLGVLFVKYQPRRTLTKKVEKTMSKMVNDMLGCGIFETKIPYAVAVPESQISGESVFSYDAKSKVAKAYLEFAEEVLKGVKENG